MQTETGPESLELEFEKSFERQPTSYSWGFFAYDDAPGGIGGGAGNFSWFDSKEDLVLFVQKFPLLAHSFGSPDVEKLESVRGFLEKVSVEKFDQSTVDELNKLNRGVEQIQWFGQFQELLSGETEFAQGLRKFFSSSTNSLSKNRIPEFAEFLRNWGH